MWTVVRFMLPNAGTPRRVTWHGSLMGGVDVSVHLGYWPGGGCVEDDTEGKGRVCRGHRHDKGEHTRNQHHSRCSRRM